MASSPHQTHYEILGITRKAEPKEVRDAYRKLALKFHPDKDPHNPQAVAAFQKLGAAYETLSDGNRRMIYDATLSSSHRLRQPPQPANWPPHRSSNLGTTTSAWQEDPRKRAWDWSRRAQERADQARREDDAFWSGPTYAHGAPDRNGWGKQWDWEQKDKSDPYENQQRQRAARKEARREAERKKHDADIPPPRDPFDQGTEGLKAQAERDKKTQESQEKFERERREDDENWGNPPSPQAFNPKWSEKVEKEYQKRVEKEKKKLEDRRRAEREQAEKEWLAELQLLRSGIISIKLNIEKMEAKVDESKMATQDEREDENYEHIFHLQIKRKSLKRRLKENLNEYKRITDLLRDRGRGQGANDADAKLQEAREEVARDERSGSGRWQGEQAEPTKKTRAKGKADNDRGKPFVNNEGFYPDQKWNTPLPSEPSKPRGGKGERPPKMTPHMYDGQNEEDTTRQQQQFPEHMAGPRVNYDYSDPERGFTEDTIEPSIAGDDSDYDDEDYDPPFCNDFHDSHMEVHREFWDIIDSWHECNFCHRVCTVMRCPKCDVQACGYCKDKFA